jgi:peroxiredoxin
MPITQDEILSQEAADVLGSTVGPARTARRRVLYFMRSIDCRVCRRHVERLAELAPALAALDAEVVVIAPGARANEQPAWTGTLPFPITLSKELFAVADLRRVLGAVQRCGTFVLDADLSVLLARRSTLPFKSFCDEEVLARLRRASAFVPGPAQVA